MSLVTIFIAKIALDSYSCTVKSGSVQISKPKRVSVVQGFDKSYEAAIERRTKIKIMKRDLMQLTEKLQSVEQHIITDDARTVAVSHTLSPPVDANYNPYRETLSLNDIVHVLLPMRRSTLCSEGSPNNKQTSSAWLHVST